MSLDEYKTTAEVAAALGISVAEVERCRKLFGIETGKFGGTRVWTQEQVDQLDSLRTAYFAGECPFCERRLPWPAPKPRARKQVVPPAASHDEPEAE